VAVEVDRLWRAVAAGLCGSLAHGALMALKSRAGWLPGFEPYRDLQALLAGLVGTSVDPLVPWLLSYFNGAVVLGFLFGRVHRRLPGRNGALKGAGFGLLIWVVMGVTFFPLIGKGPFATRTGLGLSPTLFSLLMVLAYSITLGVVYAAFDPDRRRGRPRA
jgi:Na+/proline symporter